MPTDDERREVARRLRKLHLGGGSKDLIERTLAEAIGAWRENGMSWDFITERLADLIEPEAPTSSDAAPTCDRDWLLEIVVRLESEYPDSRDAAVCVMDDVAKEIREAVGA